MTRRAVALLLAAALALGACSDGDDGAGPSTTAGPAADAESVLAAYADEVAVAGYRTLVDRLDALGTAVDALCAEPGSEGLDAARSAWRGAVEAWSAGIAGGIGPAMDRRLRADVAFTSRPAAVARLLDGSEPVDAEALAAGGAPTRGLYAIESLLFDGGADDLLSAGGARRCAYAAGATTVAGDATRAVLADWTGGYRDELVAGLGGERLMSVDQVLNQLLAALRDVDDKGLRDLVALAPGEEPQANRADGPGAHLMAQHRVLAHVVAEAVRGPGHTPGLVALVAERSAGTAERLGAAADEVAAAVEVLPDSVAEALDDRAALERAGEAVAALKVLLGTEVASQLGVTIRFSDSDGDS